MALACLPLVIPTAAWLWNMAAPESLWPFAEQLRPFSLSVTSLVAMPMVDDLELPVHELVYALLLVGWTILVPLRAILLFRFRRHIPGWVRSKQARENAAALKEKPWSLPFMCLIWLVILLDIMLFGQIFSFAWLGIGDQAPSFGEAMFRLGAAFFLFYGSSVIILQKMMFRLYRDLRVRQIGIGR